MKPMVKHVLQIKDRILDTLTVVESARRIDIKHAEYYDLEKLAASDLKLDGREQWAKDLLDYYRAKGERDGKAVFYHSSWLGGPPIEL